MDKAMRNGGTEVNEITRRINVLRKQITDLETEQLPRFRDYLAHGFTEWAADIAEVEGKVAELKEERKSLLAMRGRVLSRGFN